MFRTSSKPQEMSDERVSVIIPYSDPHKQPVLTTHKQGRVTRTPSRANTPGRNRSKTPVRTPTRRRRATIVNANMLTPRRHRVSVTPQNALRNLARALVREEQEQKATLVPKALVDEEHHPPSSAEEVARPDTRESRTSDLTDPVLSPPLQPAENASAHGEPFFDDDIDFQNNHHNDNDAELQPDKPHSSLFSDIAIPEGIMADEDGIAGYSNRSDPFNDGDDTHLSVHLPPVDPMTMTKKSNPAKSARKSQQRLDPLMTRRLFKQFQLYTKRTFAPECQQVIATISSEFFDQITDDLEAYASYAHSKTIDIKSGYLLTKRQKMVRSTNDLLDLMNEVLPMEDVLEVKRHLKRLR